MIVNLQTSRTGDQTAGELLTCGVLRSAERAGPAWPLGDWPLGACSFTTPLGPGQGGVTRGRGTLGSARCRWAHWTMLRHTPTEERTLLVNFKEHLAIGDALSKTNLGIYHTKQNKQHICPDLSEEIGSVV